MTSRDPDPEEVYRHALRLDERTRTVTDRFGWSALLVGDRSLAGRGLPERYRADLRARAGDRVRFAFSCPDGGLPFARRLGVDEHVPCLVVLTDVEDTGAHVLPIADRTADDVHRLLRSWVDDHHEANRERLERWTGVERELHRLLGSLSGSLRAVRDWSAEQRAGRRRLRRLAELVREPPHDLAALDVLLADPLLGPLADALSTCRARVAESDGVLAARRRVVDAAGRLAGADAPSTVRQVLADLVADTAARRALSAETLSAARSAFTGDDDPEDFRRWREGNRPLFAMPVFTAARQSWRWIAEQGREPGETPRRHGQRDFAAFTRALAAQPLADPGAAADAVLDALAAHHDVTDDAEWAGATAGFHAYLVDAISRLRSSAPPGFALVGHCLPGFPPPVRPLDERERGLRDGLARLLERDAGAAGEAEEERRAALAAVPAVAEEFRVDLAARSATATPPEPTGRAELTALEELAGVLDEYDDAVRSAAHPHVADPSVIPVEGRVSACEAAGVRGGRLAVDVLREEVARTVEEYRRVVARFHSTSPRNVVP
ncbi:hypothetical protein [Saccharothrix syringae]|uniref:Uncharacterized protein n=1 Tax=Saccharothrix syringae TaxID=103733 RepID=A0A5Q0H6I1_SACSY|nr:hypothetical protein [Saccharothrix syringae]QFZ21525.1 hypothetical protein EKG83_32725 [Saccharothrix syringae]